MLFMPVCLGGTVIPAEALREDARSCRRFGPCGVGEKALYLNGSMLDRR